MNVLDFNMHLQKCDLDVLLVMNRLVMRCQVPKYNYFIIMNPLVMHLSMRWSAKHNYLIITKHLIMRLFMRWAAKYN